LHAAALYWRQCRELLHEFPASANLADLVRYFPSWYVSQDNQHTPLADELPWLTFAAIGRLKHILRPSMRVFEYGSGGSTLFFARRAASLITIEHDPAWGQKVAAALAARGYSNCELRVVLPVQVERDAMPDTSDPDTYASSDEASAGCSFEAYARTIDAYPDGHFDLVCIDGRARPSCSKHALPKVAMGGYIVWDNSERDNYQPALELAAEHFQRSDFRGPVSGYTGFVQTSILQRVTPR
jgi:predicted O-methyltransferase YrrM